MPLAQFLSQVLLFAMYLQVQEAAAEAGGWVLSRQGVIQSLTQAQHEAIAIGVLALLVCIVH
eukprot:scaffold231999_cov23-Prasinocladus_malaysianus.AAC.1